MSRMILTLCACLMLFGCDSADVSYPQRAVLHLSSMDSWTDAILAEAARADLIIMPTERICSPMNSERIARMTELNPKAAFVGYLPLLNANVPRSDTTYMRRHVPFALDYYKETRPFWAFSTSGDTLMQWPDMPMLNPIHDDAVDVEQIDIIVGLLARYKARYRLDGVLLDYFTTEPMLLRPRVEGEIDFDGNGVLWAQDAQERAVFYEYQIAFATALRERFGDDFIVIGNGRPPQEDGACAALLNGIMFEDYPGSPWGWTPKDGFLKMMYCQKPGWNAPARGRTWSVLVNYRSTATDMSFYSSLLAGCFFTDLQGSYRFTGWTRWLETGKPLASAAAVSDDYALTVSRAFERGTARVRFFGGALAYARWETK